MLDRQNVFTIQAQDVRTFNHLLNNFPKTAFPTYPNCISIYIPCSIHQVFETEKIAFLRNVDHEIMEKETEEALIEFNLEFEKFQRVVLKIIDQLNLLKSFSLIIEIVILLSVLA